jgi:hypothetical protein
VTATDWIKVISLPIIAFNIAAIVWLMRVWWFRPVGWVALTWMTCAFLFNAAVLVDKLLIDWLMPTTINILSISLHLTGYVSATIIIVIMIYTVWLESRGLQ